MSTFLISILGANNNMYHHNTIITITQSIQCKQSNIRRHSEIFHFPKLHEWGSCDINYHRSIPKRQNAPPMRIHHSLNTTFPSDFLLYTMKAAPQIAKLLPIKAMIAQSFPVTVHSIESVSVAVPSTIPGTYWAEYPLS